MSTEKIYQVLFICTGNSARSILAEGLLNHLGAGRFQGYSAGSRPKDTVHPLALTTLKALGLPDTGYRSKSWDEFAQADAPQMDIIITVCDNAATETCPVWPGQNITAHWGAADPAAVTGSDTEKQLAFLETARLFQHRIEQLLLLPLDNPDATALRQQLRDIGQQ